jgi:hypothetical protein
LKGGALHLLIAEIQASRYVMLAIHCELRVAGYNIFMLFQSLFKKTDEHVSIVFDIGNGSIGGAFVKLSKDHKPAILFTHREPVVFQEKVEPQELLALLYRHFRNVVRHLEKEGLRELHKTGMHKHISGAYCILSSPWYISQTKVIKIEKEKPFTVSRKVLGGLLAQEEQVFERSVQEGSSVIARSDVRVIERKIIQTKLNGYEVHDPYGKITSSIEVALFTSVAADDVLKQFEKILRTSFHLRAVSFHSFSLASFTALRDIFAKEENFLFIDVSSEITEITVVKQGILTENISFPLGRYSLVRDVSKKLHTTAPVTLSLIKGHGEKSFDSAIGEKLKKSIEPFQGQWCGCLHKVLKDISTSVPLPRKIFLVADSDTAAFFKASIEKEKCIEYASGDVSIEAEDGFVVVYLDDHLLSDFTEVISSSKSDSFLILGSLFAHKLLKLGSHVM